MSTDTVHHRPPLNAAADRLIQALEATASLDGLRTGLGASLAFWRGFADATNPAHREAVDLIAVWESLDALAAAVRTRRES